MQTPSASFCPPLIIEPEQIDTMMEGMRKTLDDTYMRARAKGFLG